MNTYLTTTFLPFSTCKPFIEAGTLMPARL